MKKGISLISLIITIVILLIILSTVVTSTVIITNNSKKTTFAKDLKTVEEAIINEYNTSGAIPTSGEEYTVQEIKDMTDDYAKLDLEFIENADTTSTFYKVDLNKLGIKNSSRGTGKNGSNDIYVVSDSLNLYYPLGLKIGNDTYFSLTSSLINQTKIAKPADIETGTADNVLANGIKLYKDKKIWTNSLVVTIETTLSVGETVSYTIAGIVPATPVTIVSGKTVIPLNVTTITGADATNFNSAEVQNKTIVISKVKNGVTTSATLSIKNLDIQGPVHGSGEGNTIDTSGTTKNVLTFITATDSGGSGIKEIVYDYHSKMNSSGVSEPAYNPMPTMNSTYMKNSGKKGELTKVGNSYICKVNLPKHIDGINMFYVDNAGNFSNGSTMAFSSSGILKEEARDSLNDYVKDGLVLHLDAINNTGTGHSSTTATWKDLSGKSKDGIMTNFNNNTVSGWGSNYLRFDGVDTIGDIVQINDIQNILVRPNLYTVEMVFIPRENTVVNGSTYGLIGVNGSIGLPSGQTMGLKTWGSAVPGQFIFATIVGDNVSLSTSVGQDCIFDQKTAIQYYNNGSEIGIYKNGINKQKLSYNYTPVFNRTFIYIGQVSATRYAKMDLYALRIYNRVLSEQEVKQNYANDIKRFGL